ncbi:MAG: UDP-N-acetylglucosamine 2-epimerase (hydrolyzing) [Desulfobacterales bacterium]|nr:UDP-N-acetylglucosamine 2-epimerase (hydrolyzing) [Desulfobacterales bacterium]
MRKICVFTGTRAEYGLLKPLLDEIKSDSELLLSLLVSGMHMSPEFGLTYKGVESDGFKIDEKVEMLISSDTSVGLCKSVGLGIISFSDALTHLSPDIFVVLGDRFEAFAAASSAMFLRIPIAHIHGGELTEGVIDDAIRHSITKMSHIHFVSTELYRKRVIQLGESPDSVFNVGAIGLENIRKLKLLSKKDFESKIGFSIGKEESLLVTFHPVTLESNTAQNQFQNLLDALPKVKVIFTKANADTDGRIINKMIDDYVAKHPKNTIAFTSMGQLLYLSAMSHVSAVVGNSSSGIIEAPSFKVPTVNIGDRQRGRIKSKSIIDCEPTKEAVFDALKQSMSHEFKASIKDTKNVYEKENTASSIKAILKTTNLNNILKKKFYDIG